MELVRYVGERIRELRCSCAGTGISQESLAKTMKITANTVSRWETGTYRPSLEDLDALSRLFSVSILEFFPKENEPKDDHVAALLRAARDLPPEDIEELRRYADFRKARALFGSGAAKKKAGRPRTAEA
jgi:transcriptional regulator with XRE-family HTH domain